MVYRRATGNETPAQSRIGNLGFQREFIVDPRPPSAVQRLVGRKEPEQVG